MPKRSSNKLTRNGQKTISRKQRAISKRSKNREQREESAIAQNPLQQQFGALAAGEIRDKWVSLGGEKSPLGYQIADEEVTADGEKIVKFQHGLIRWTQGQGRGARIELNIVTLPRKTITR